jgi:hypothetical protein
MRKAQHDTPGIPNIAPPVDAVLDASLADTFPASDPIALVWPHKPIEVVTGRATSVWNGDVEPRSKSRVHRGGGSTC